MPAGQHKPAPLAPDSCGSARRAAVAGTRRITCAQRAQRVSFVHMLGRVRRAGCCSRCGAHEAVRLRGRFSFFLLVILPSAFLVCAFCPFAFVSRSPSPLSPRASLFLLGFSLRAALHVDNLCARFLLLPARRRSTVQQQSTLDGSGRLGFERAAGSPPTR